MTVLLVAKSREHPIEETLDMQRVLTKTVIPWLKTGATAGRTVLNVAHTHMGEPDNAEYEVIYCLESSEETRDG